MDFYVAIVDALEGRGTGIAKERLDWSGPGAVLEIFENTYLERDAFIAAMSDIINNAGKHPPFVTAQLIDIACSLDITQVGSSVEKLQNKRIGKEEPIKSAIEHFLAVKQLWTS